MNLGERVSKLMAFSEGRGRLTYLSMALSMCSAALSVVPFYYIWLVLEEVLEVMPDYGLATGVVSNSLAALAFTLVSVLLYVASLLCSHRSAFAVSNNMRKALLRKAGEMPPGTYDMMGSGKVRRTIQDSTGATENFLAHILPDMAGSAVLPLAVLVMLFLFDWRLGLASLGVVALGFVVMMTMMNDKELADSMMAYQGELGNINKEAVEYVRGIAVVKTFGQSVDSFGAFRDSILGYSAFAIKYTKWCKGRMALFVVMANFAFAAIIFVGLGVFGGLQWSDEFLLDFLFYAVFTPIIPALLMKILYSGEEMYVVDDAIMRIEELMAMEPLPEPAEPVVPEDHTVRFEDVTFAYPGSEVPAVEGLTLTMEQGRITALVGPSGSGKSTAASLACRYWDPTSGRITVGGVDLRDIGSRNLSEMIGFVHQSNRLLKGTLLYNVRLGKPDATDEEVARALEIAQCSDIVAKLPDGLETEIGPGGVYLSGGEVQRIAIARTVLRDPPIIILDEATAFADPENEALVQKAFTELSKDRTVLIIAHRLTTVRNADSICVMERGRITERGDHPSLMGESGTYSRMWNDYQQALSWRVAE